MNHPAPVAPPRATYADVLAAPEHMVAELVDGRLRLQPRPRVRHAIVASSLGEEILGPFQKGRNGPGGWWILAEPELHLGEHVIVPDLAGWRRTRMAVPPDAAFLTLAPDWACEVLSPGTRRLDLTRKRAIYAEHGVAHLWFVDPDARTLEAFALDSGGWRLAAALGGAEETRVAPFDAVAFPLDALWPPEPDEGA
jgi:Uma2 family endonuclease